MISMTGCESSYGGGYSEFPASYGGGGYPGYIGGGPYPYGGGGYRGYPDSSQRYHDQQRYQQQQHQRYQQQRYQSQPPPQQQARPLSPPTGRSSDEEEGLRKLRMLGIQPRR
jgi:hypothetical protein